MKRHYLSTALTCLLILVLAFGLDSVSRSGRIRGSIRVGFLFENDEATPYTYNFSLARDALEQSYPDKVEILTLSNVLASETDEPIRSLIRQGCQMLGMEVRDVAQVCIEGMKEHAGELGLLGTESSDD